jgi:hypothetical protein
MMGIIKGGTRPALHASGLALEFEEFSQTHGSPVPNLPGLAEEIHLEYIRDTVPNPGTRSDLKGLGLFIIFWVYGTSLGGVNHYFVRCPV